MLAELPESAAELQYISVVVNDPEFEPYFGAGEIVRGADVPRDLIDGDAPLRVRAGGGCGRVRAPRRGSCLLGELPRQPPPRPQRGTRAAGGDGRAAARRGGGGRLVERGPRRVRVGASRRTEPAGTARGFSFSATHEYRESISLFFADSVRTPTFPSPWLKQSPTIYRRSEERDGEQRRPHRRVVRGGVRPRADALSRLHHRRTSRAGHRPSRRVSTSTC